MLNLLKFLKKKDINEGLKDQNGPRKLITICLTTSPMKGREGEFLRKNLDVLSLQTFKDFDIVVSDQSPTDTLEKICSEYSNRPNNSLDIKYYRNSKGPYTSSENVNRGIKKSTGKLIKFIFLDDFLYSNDSLKDIAENFDLEKDHWLVTACEHSNDGVTFYRPFYPRYHDKIYLGDNTISSPSVLTIKNEDVIYFDKRMIWHMDIDYYKRLYDKWGPPKILNKINVVNRTGDHQVSNTRATRDRRGLEYRWSLVKFKEKELLREYDRVVSRSYRTKKFLRMHFPFLVKIKQYFSPIQP